MKRILGLDLGVGSIGWCLIEREGNDIAIRKIGSRIIPLISGESDEFKKGSSISKNAERTQRRTARKTYDRYQQRRKQLADKLSELNMLPTQQLFDLNPLETWELRSKAASKQVSLQELGRVLYHINQKRGYKHSRQDNDSKTTAYVAEVNNRHNQIRKEGKVIGQYFAEKMRESECVNENGKKHYTFRIKEQVLPRIAYEEEFNKIMEVQKVYYPNLLTDELIKEFFNFIFYQRPLKSCKHLVSICEIEKHLHITPDGKEIVIGPKVAPKSSPISQICKIWESVNNLKISNRHNDILYIDKEKKQEIVAYMNTHFSLKVTDLYKILGINKHEGWWAGKTVGKGLQGNVTRLKIEEALEDLPKKEREDLLKFEVSEEEIIDKETGEIQRIINDKVINEPLYKLWHMIYSIKDKEEFRNALIKSGISNDKTLDKLCELDFVKDGYANKSVKAMRRILPYLMDGEQLSDACLSAGFRHSDYHTKEETFAIKLKNSLPQIKKNELRQPVVEKVLNQMINIVNAILSEYGMIDEIRVELARELKQSREERNDAWTSINRNERKNNEIAKRIKEEYGIIPTRNRIQKYKMWEETNHFCIYCNKPVGVVEFLKGADYEKEHIIPKSMLFDNSFSNQTCSCHDCNHEKGNRTAYDYIKDKYPTTGLETYIDNVNKLYEKKQISKTKRDHLLASYVEYCNRKAKGKETEEDKNLWENFIERQLRQSQFIATKAVEILHQVCHTVTTTTGSVTDYIRHIWGYDEILHDLNFERFKAARLTEFITTVSNGEEKTRERIVNWSKRIDNRHHAIDALAVALTSQSMIQRLNTLNAQRESMKEEVKESTIEWKEKSSLLEKWILAQPHPSYENVKGKVSEILISVKSGQRVTTRGKRYEYKHGKRILKQEGIIVPRTALHDQYVYGQIMQYIKDGDRYVLQPAFVKRYNLGIGAQGFLFTGKETYKETEKKDKNGQIRIVVEDKILETVNKVVDQKIRRLIINRLNEGFADDTDYRSNPKKALENLKNLDSNPIYFDEEKTMPIRTVRKYVSSSTMVPVRYDKEGKAISFVEPGRNHSVTIYKMSNGEYKENIITMWQAVERKLNDLNVIIENPSEVWDEVTNRDDIAEEIMRALPPAEGEYVTSMQINDTFILGLDNDAVESAINHKDYTLLANHLYIVQNLSSMNYRFRRHVESQFDKKDMNSEDKRFYNIASIPALMALNPIKVNISIMGDIKRI